MHTLTVNIAEGQSGHLISVLRQICIVLDQLEGGILLEPLGRGIQGVGELRDLRD